MYSNIYFSPTGNALHLARKLADFLDYDPAKLLPLEFVDLKLLKPEKHLVLIYPVHGFNAPRTVKRFVKEVPASRLFGLELHANNACTSCVTCWNNCPEKAISPRFSKFIPIRKGYDLKKFRPRD